MKELCIYCGEELASWQRNRSYCTMCKEAMEEVYSDDMYDNDK
ncbi:hypothetical protein [Aneurinibacillus migulanus]|uniref:YhfH-like protein n=1 Tax=Aneurinibacillus migulanus TaxID=47500 RepID=A0A1G8VAR5_ANEMI|nr:hypothetical protein [Aneurinibacillus migulanus]MED0896184.1 hypothetical protein [Aneurinibacillus migulanus]MED1618146.1 hypothetical protein [Aneurinibacillus migulanus]MED4732340.1 hypothetical protein [Aneurinibacillus migulanus]SDJ62260.1 hypothetical protein SAMN04487909_12280 [Aneurinibacillus migulanus]GED17049.1 hypothetical protein AMI01nite_50400 [Aneurinibacillus migulanus]